MAEPPTRGELTGDFVRAAEFQSRLRGYDPADVDPLLDDLADTIDRARAQLDELGVADDGDPGDASLPADAPALAAKLAALLHIREAVSRAQEFLHRTHAWANRTDAEVRHERALAIAETLLTEQRLADARKRDEEETTPPAATVPAMDERRCLLTVHAHPDDEASKGAGTVAKYHAEGVRTVLVCCTGGEAGDILNPAMDTPEVRLQLAEVRRGELEVAAQVIGYDEVVMLGYHDSGMPDSEANHNPDCFARAPLDEAVGRLVAILRKERPQVVITYGDRQERYPHPDHLRVHEVTMAAVDAAADPDRYTDAGPPWAVAKVYYTAWSRSRILATHEKFGELGLESPFQASWFEGPDPDYRAHDAHRAARRLRGHPARSAARARNADRPDVAVLVRPAARSPTRDPSLRRLHPGPGRAR